MTTSRDRTNRGCFALRTALLAMDKSPRLQEIDTQFGFKPLNPSDDRKLFRIINQLLDLLDNQAQAELAYAVYDTMEKLKDAQDDGSN